MMPILFPYDATEFTTNGIGTLSDAISCKVTRERNGEYIMQMTYPVTGAHYDDIALRSIILVKPCHTGDPQAMRVYRISRPINGQVTVYCQHISYDLTGYICPPLSNSYNACQFAFNAMKAAAVPSTPPFTFDGSGCRRHGTFSVTEPTSLRALLGGTEGSILDTYHGEYEFNNFTVKCADSIGYDRGVRIRYGKNLTDFQQEQECAAVYTGIYPFWKSEDQDGTVRYVQCDPPVIDFGSFRFLICDDDGSVVADTDTQVGTPEDLLMHKRVMTLNLTDSFDDMPAPEQLEQAAESYAINNDITVPRVSMTLSFAQLEQTSEYAGKALLERVELCDTVTVEFPSMGVEASAKVTTTVYDVLLDRYESVTLGTVQTNFCDAITGKAVEEAAIETASYASELRKAIVDATNLITGNSGGNVVIYDRDNDGKPDEILITDNEDLAHARKVWRWNASGLGYSSNGYEGPFETAMTADGRIVADFITAGTMTADHIRGGTMQLGGRSNGSGIMRLYDYADVEYGKIDYKGLHLTDNGGTNTLDVAYGRIVNKAPQSTLTIADSGVYFESPDGYSRGHLASSIGGDRGGVHLDGNDYVRVGTHSGNGGIEIKRTDDAEVINIGGESSEIHFIGNIKIGAQDVFTGSVEYLGWDGVRRGLLFNNGLLRSVT